LLIRLTIVGLPVPLKRTQNLSVDSGSCGFTVSRMNTIELAAATAATEAFILEATAHLGTIERLDTEGKIAWKTIESPRGSRSFDGVGEGYTVLVTQFNAVGRGIGHAGMLTHLSTGVFVALPSQNAERLFRAVAARMN